MLNTPSFWYKNAPTLTAQALKPFALIYRHMSRLHRVLSHPKSVDVPIICVGNFNAGGSGKTPSSIALMQLITSHTLAQSPFFLTRGYGGAGSHTPLRVDPNTHLFRDVGDEALLLARHAPTIVSRDRYDGARMAIDHGADCIIMDDGLQNYDLDYALKIAVVDGAMGFGNGLTLPAGPLRVDPAHAIENVDFVICIGDDTATGAFSCIPAEKKLHATVRPKDGDLNKSQPYIAFCGLGYPQKFFDTLNNLDIDVLDTHIFPDHHPYRDSDLMRLIQDAKTYKARLITTEKDMVRIDSVHHDSIDVLPISLIFDDSDPLIHTLTNAISL